MAHVALGRRSLGEHMFAGHDETLTGMEFDVGLDKQHLEALGATAPLTGIIELVWNSLRGRVQWIEDGRRYDPVCA